MTSTSHTKRYSESLNPWHKNLDVSDFNFNFNFKISVPRQVWKRGVERDRALTQTLKSDPGEGRCILP